MIRAGFLALVLTGPAGAGALAGQALCAAAWARVAGGLAEAASVGGTVTQGGDWCVVDGAMLDLPGEYVPDWQMDRLRFRGSALGWIADGSTLPEGLEIGVEGLRLVIQTGDARTDWLFAAQARANVIAAEAALSWDPAGRVLRLEGLGVDFPGDSSLDLSAVVTGVDLSSAGAVQLSATSFALSELDLAVTTHGLFEWYALMVLGPVRVAGYALTGVPGTMAEAAPLFQGVTVDVGWTPGDAP